MILNEIPEETQSAARVENAIQHARYRAREVGGNPAILQSIFWHCDKRTRLHLLLVDKESFAHLAGSLYRDCYLQDVMRMRSATPPYVSSAS